MRAFCYSTLKGEPRVGIEMDGKKYNFTYIWQIYKELKSSPQTPDYYFLQIMIEMENFSASVFNDVLGEIKSFRSLDDLVITEKFRYEVPISRPGKIICLGRNYRAHAEEWKSQVPEVPMFFSKLPSALLPHEGHIRIPDGIGRVDHEVELAVIIGKRGVRVSESSAMEHVAGYTIVNDVTARAMQGVAIKNGQPWTLSKSMDTFCPMGPYLIPADTVPDPHNLPLELSVNGVTKQKANTRDMVFKIPQLVAYISKYITLEVGDIICTGTPEGTLPIEPGDVITARVGDFGELRNTVIRG
ncbi:MAG TPA: fumarylacetoacetate hydrolase family protein [bacterium]|nr:fumarylacetoacetate hydrolase family protein [bacterium]HPN43653.1 fumarylacetoacetate hydrolase family protein [bacterium]